MKSNGLKYIFLALIAAAFLCFVMGGVTLRREILSRLQQPPASKPSPLGRRTYPPPPAVLSQRRSPQPPQAPITNAPGPVLSIGTPVSPGLPTPGQRLGKFEGQTLLESRAIVCGASIEIYEDAAKNGQVIAYETFACVDPMAMYSAPKNKAAVRGMVMGIAGQRLPVMYILSGQRQAGGVVELSVAQTAGHHDRCVMTKGSLIPFGNRLLLFRWEDGACGTGEMQLTQVGM